MRGIFPSNLFRAELLKAVKYPEISYRKFCTEEYFGLDRKQNRVFTGLSLSKKEMIDHTQLSKFRSTLTFLQQINLLGGCPRMQFCPNSSLFCKNNARNINYMAVLVSTKCLDFEQNIYSRTAS